MRCRSGPGSAKSREDSHGRARSQGDGHGSANRKETRTNHNMRQEAPRTTAPTCMYSHQNDCSCFFHSSNKTRANVIPGIVWKMGSWVTRLSIESIDENSATWYHLLNTGYSLNWSVVSMNLRGTRRQSSSGCVHHQTLDSANRIGYLDHAKERDGISCVLWPVTVDAVGQLWWRTLECDLIRCREFVPLEPVLEAVNGFGK